MLYEVGSSGVGQRGDKGATRYGMRMHREVGEAWQVRGVGRTGEWWAAFLQVGGNAVGAGVAVANREVGR